MGTTRWKILGSYVDFVDSIEIAEEFRNILRGWEIEVIPYESSHPAYLTFVKERGRYSWNAPWARGRERHIDDFSETVMDAVCNFHYEFIDWVVDRHPAQFCLHSACVSFGKTSVLFPCAQKSGKSILSIQLVFRGHRLIGDDVVGLSENGLEAIALGLLPRLRLPLPSEILTSPLVNFINHRKGLSDEDWQYVKLNEFELASLNETSSIGGIVLLERGNSGSPKLEDISKSLALKALIDQNFGRTGDPHGIFDCLKSLALSVPCKLLRFSRPDEAADILEQYFGNQPCG